MAVTNEFMPELLSPAGDREKLEMALHYGADAVYLGGNAFSLRAAAGNFDASGLVEAVQMSHRAGAKVYVTVNNLPREPDLSALPGFLECAAAAGADAFILSDLGVLAMARRLAPGVALHASTQMGVVNSAAARFLLEQGVSRVILARELSLEEIRAIRAAVPAELELEVFVHGAMCVSFSGRCLLSNYLAGRDGNGGVCAQPCRWRYHLVEETRPGKFFEITEDPQGTHILNAADLCMIEHLGQLRDAGIASFKIEGRMKSAYYTGMATYAYRHALDDLAEGKPFDPTWLDECVKLSHRPYSTGFYFGPPEQRYDEPMYTAGAKVCAVVESCDGDGESVLTERNRFSRGDQVELVRRTGKPLAFPVTDLRDGDGQPLDCARHPMMRLRMRLPVPAERLSILRKLP